MELKKINYNSALFFGVFPLVMYILSGLVQMIIAKIVPAYAAQLGQINVLRTLVYIPVISAVTTYLFALVAIFVYNKLSKKCPISWELKK